MNPFLGVSILPEPTALVALLVRFAINLLFAGVIVGLAKTRLSQHREYRFTFLLVNVVTFSIAYQLNRSPIELGLALGLFGVFGILRYRTEALQVRHLTYLFIVIGLALLNALAAGGISIVELLVVNTLIAGAVAALESTSLSGQEVSSHVLYDRLDLLHPGRIPELLDDLRSRTNLPVARCEIGDIDLLRDAADVIVYYRVTGRHEFAKPS